MLPRLRWEPPTTAVSAVATHLGRDVVISSVERHLDAEWVRVNLRVTDLHDDDPEEVAFAAAHRDGGLPPRWRPRDPLRVLADTISVRVSIQGIGLRLIDATAGGLPRPREHVSWVWCAPRAVASLKVGMASVWFPLQVDLRHHGHDTALCLSPAEFHVPGGRPVVRAARPLRSAPTRSRPPVSDQVEWRTRTRTHGA